MIRPGNRTAFLAFLRMLGALGPGERADHHIDRLPGELGLEVLMSPWRDLREELLHHPETELRVRHLASTKTKSRLHLHVLAKKIDRVRHLGLEIVRINVRTELDLLHLVRVLVLAALLLPLLLLVLELAELHQPADRRIGVGRNLDEVHSLLTRQYQGVGERDDSKLLTFLANHAHLPGADLAVDTERRPTRGVTGGERSTQETLTGLRKRSVAMRFH